MKKSLAIVAIILALFGAAYAADQLIPAVGMKTGVSTAQKYGCYSFTNNGNVYKYVLNSSTEAVTAGYPAFYDFSSGNNYTVTGYDGINYGTQEAFAGVWYCSSSGSSTISASSYGWIQIGGTASAYVRNTAGAISVGSHLTGAGTYKALVLTANAASVEGIYAGFKPMALEAQNSSTASRISVQLFGKF